MQKTLQQIGIQITGTLCAIVSVAAALSFIAVSFWSGFRIYFPSRTISVTNPVRPLLIALVFALVYEGFASRARKRGDIVACQESAAKDDYRKACYPWWAFFVAILIGIRFAYKIYEPFLIGRTTDITVMVYVPFMVMAAVVGAWRTHRCLQASSPASQFFWFPVLLWGLAPLAFPVHPLTTVFFWVAALVQPVSLPGVRPAKWQSGYVWAVTFVLSVLLLILLATIGSGWAGKRAIVTVFHSFTFELLLCFGICAATLMLKPRGIFSAGMHRAGWVALPGIVLAGTHGIWGTAGVILLLPLVTVLLSTALSDWNQRLERASLHFVRNIIQLCLVGLIFGFIGSSLTRHVRAPVHQAKTAAAAAQFDLSPSMVTLYDD